MKLAEALIERADIQTKLEMLRGRMINNAKVQEGCEPTESPQALREELDRLCTRLEYLITHINRTNELTKVGDSTIAEMIAKKDVLSKKISILGDLLNNGSALVSRITHAEIRVQPSFSVPELQREMDLLAEELRLTDTALQGANWTTELI